LKTTEINSRKLNEVGLKLIEYKKELEKNYPKIIKDSLLLSLEQMADNKIIDLSTYELIKSEDENMDTFTSFLLTQNKYTKTNKELFSEYETLRKNLEEELDIMHEVNDLNTVTVVEKDLIQVIKTFSIDKDFIINYFGITEQEFPKLTKKKGFMDQFVALRLTKILKDIINQNQKILSLLRLKNSLTYFNEAEEKYSIDLIMEILVDDIFKEENKEKIISEIKETRTLSGKIYNSKMLC